MQIQLTKNVSAPQLQTPLVNSVAKAVTKHVPYPQQYSVSIVATGDGLMRKLNEEHRSVNDVTDVLSFPYDDTSGEIVICYPQAQRQAKSKQTTVKKELSWLLVHGLLHLQGYDHETAEDAKVMRPLEQQILQSL